MLLATVLIDRWRDAKRDYRDNTPEHSAAECPVEGNKIGQTPDKCIVREGREMKFKALHKRNALAPFREQRRDLTEDR